MNHFTTDAVECGWSSFDWQVTTLSQSVIILNLEGAGGFSSSVFDRRN